MPRSLAGAGGPVLGLLFVTITFAALIGASFFLPGNLELIARQTTIVCAAALGMTVIIVSGGHRSLGWIGRRAHDRHRRAGAWPGLVAARRCARRCCRRRHLRAGERYPRDRPPRRAVHRHAGHDDPCARRGQGSRRRASHRGAADLAERSVARARSRRSRRPPGRRLARPLFSPLFVSRSCFGSTRLGRHAFAIGSNERTARLCGVAVSRTKLVVYTIGALFAGVAGVLQFSRLSVGDPTVANGLKLERDRRGDHRRRQPLRRTWHCVGHVAWRDDDGRDSDRLRPEGLPELGATDRDRRDHRARRRARSMATGETS